MNAEHAVGAHAHFRFHLEGDVHPFVQDPRLYEMAVAKLDLEAAQRRAAICEHMIVHQVREVSSREPDLGARDPDGEAGLVIEVHDTGASAHESVHATNVKHDIAARSKVDVSHLYGGRRRVRFFWLGMKRGLRRCGQWSRRAL